MDPVLKFSRHVNHDEMEIVYWDGGISVWAPGRATTLDSDGQEPHGLN